MNGKMRMPGFNAELALEGTTQWKHYAGVWNNSSIQQMVIPQAGNEDFLCGLALAATIGGFGIGNPSLVFGGIWAIDRYC